MDLPSATPGFSPPDVLGEATMMRSAAPTALLDFFFPGFSMLSTAVLKYLHIDLNLYIPLILLFGGFIFMWRYFSEYLWSLVETHMMSVVDIRVDDEIYNMLMTWVASQNFSQRARRFVVNTSLNSRSWYVMWSNWHEDDDEGDEGEDEESTSRRGKKKALAYTPTFGSHWFWYKGRLLIFRRSENRDSSAFLPASEREEISVSCFGRNPWVLKELLHEARTQYLKKDQQKTLIYRGTVKAGGGSAEPCWQRCLARSSRPFSTVILNEKVKSDLIADVKDYLDPATRTWYSNRGIPYRRGYLLHGPPGTGKSSLSLALAGHFKMRIYIVSLSSISSNEENLASLFAELPRRCVVLLEDIDTAGLTHTRDDQEGSDDGASENGNNDADGSGSSGGTKSRDPRKRSASTANANNNSGRLSLSGLLNILDGVASQEGRVLIMTTNHVEKLDKALIRPGRVDMIVKFDRADHGMVAAIFQAIFAPLEGDDLAAAAAAKAAVDGAKVRNLGEDELAAQKKKAEEAARHKEKVTAEVKVLAERFADKIPAHEFSPAEIQGFLLKNKRTPERAVETAEEWVVEARKEKKEKELKDAEDKRKKEEADKKQADEDAAKKKEEEEKKKKEEEKKKQEEEKEEKKKRKEAKREAKRKTKKTKHRRKSKKDRDSDSSDSSDDSATDSEDEETKKREATDKPTPAPAAEKPAAPVPEVEAKVVLTPESDSDAPVVVEAKELLADETKQGVDSGYGTPA